MCNFHCQRVGVVYYPVNDTVNTYDEQECLENGATVHVVISFTERDMFTIDYYCEHAF